MLTCAAAVACWMRRLGGGARQASRDAEGERLFRDLVAAIRAGGGKQCAPPHTHTRTYTPTHTCHHTHPQHIGPVPFSDSPA